MFSDQNGQGKILKVLIWVLIGLTTLFSLSSPTANGLYFFLLFFILAHWQKTICQKLFGQLTKLISPFWSYLLLTVIWAAILELTLARLAFHLNTVVNFLISLGFYLPYFVIWYKLTKRFNFNFLEVFYLAGISGILFALIITKQILISFMIHPSLKIAFLAFGGRIMATLVTWGALTSLPCLLLLKKETLFEKPVGHYLLALSSTFLALSIFLIWSNLANLLLSKV